MRNFNRRYAPQFPLARNRYLASSFIQAGAAASFSGQRNASPVISMRWPITASLRASATQASQDRDSDHRNYAIDEARQTASLPAPKGAMSRRSVKRCNTAGPSWASAASNAAGNASVRSTDQAATP